MYEINNTYIVNFVNTNEIKTYRLIIKGKVQNVGFRHWFSDLAISLGLNGYVQNKESKDEVEAIIQGDMQSILSITQKAKDGPEMALVEGELADVKSTVLNLMSTYINSKKWKLF